MRAAPQPPAQMPFVTPVVGAIIVANLVTYFVQSDAGAVLLAKLALWPLNLGSDRRSLFAIWQLFTYGFLHGSDGHLFFNMFALWMFGKHLEMRWGSWPFATYYFLCVIGAGMVQLFVSEIGFSGGPTIGASGGVFGLLLAYGMMFPNAMIMLLIPPIPMRARTFVIGYGILTLLMGLTGTAPLVAHFAHLGGMLVGYLVIRWWPSLVPLGPPTRR